MILDVNVVRGRAAPILLRAADGQTKLRRLRCEGLGGLARRIACFGDRHSGLAELPADALILI